MQFSRGKSALVFCSTRKGAQEAAQKISQTAMKFGNSNPFIKSGEQQERLREASLSCSDRQMQSYILYGVGYHNGGLCMKDRNLIESLFLNGDIQVLCTTNTLAHGINLPAHTVVIKSTQHYNKEKNHYMEYDRSTVLQMCGRAGRPPFDDTGMVIIMTRKETVHLYENLLNGCETVESQLLSCMTEHLTAEIVQLTVPDITRAIEWMKCSFLYKPENYGFEKGISKDRIERHMHEVCVQKVNELSKYQMIWTDEDGFVLNPLEPGKLMTKYYLKMDTMKYIMQTSPSCNLEDILHTVSRAEELSWIQLRRNEKKILNDINIDKDSRLRFHIIGDRGKRKKRIQTREEKIFVLANDCLTGDPCTHDLSLTQDANSIGSNGSRVAKCMKDYFIYKKNYKGALNSSLLAKSLHQKLWDDSPYLLKQLPGIGMVTAKALHSMGVNSFETLLEADPRRIEIITGRKYPFGNHIKESLHVLPPKVEMNIETAESHGRQMPKLAMKLSRLSESKSVKRHYADMFIGLQEDNLIVYHEKIRVEEFTSPYCTTITLPKLEQGKATFKAHLIFEEYIGIDLYQIQMVNNEMNSDITPRKVVTRQLTFPKPVKINEVEGKSGSKLPPPPQHDKTPAKESSKKLDFMPSFDLLDEELDEALLAMTEEDDECRIIDDRTVFDHIRKKAKNFPTVAAPLDTQSPSPETLKLGRKRLCEMQPGSHSLPEGFLDEDHEMVSLVSETGKVDQSRTMTRETTTYKPRFIARSLDIVNLVDNGGSSKSSGSLPPLVANPEESKESETLFDHVRKKFKKPPIALSSKPNHPDYPSSSKQRDHLFTDQLDFSIIPDYTTEASRTSNNAQPNNTTILLDSKPSQPEHSTFCTAKGLCDDPPVPQDVPTMTKANECGDVIAPALLASKQKGPKSPGCWTAAAILDAWKGDQSIGESYLGFRSVFSFL
ncbi:hypothetical protein V2J09_011652 [Rumex salicifolius]